MSTTRAWSTPRSACAQRVRAFRWRWPTVGSRITPSSLPRSERVTDGSVTIARARFDLEAVARAVGAAGIAGVLVGVPAGLLSRVVMKVSALAAGPTVAGHLTENGAVVGALTAEGTLFLVLFAGRVPARSAANLVVAIRPWLLPFGRWSRIVFGVYVLAWRVRSCSIHSTSTSYALGRRSSLLLCSARFSSRSGSRSWR